MHLNLLQKTVTVKKDRKQGRGEAVAVKPSLSRSLILVISLASHFSDSHDTVGWLSFYP